MSSTDSLIHQNLWQNGKRILLKPPESSRLIEVRNLGNGTELIYPGDYFKSLQVYNVSGQKG
jgi:hypothetical protein